MVVDVQILLTAIGSLFAAVLSYIYYIEKRNSKATKELAERHERERKEWAEAAAKERKEMLEVNKQQFDQLFELSEENNKIDREHINILVGLKTILENPRRHER